MCYGLSSLNIYIKKEKCVKAHLFTSWETKGITINCLRVFPVHAERIYYNRGIHFCVCVSQFNSLSLSKVLLWDVQLLESASWTIQRLKRVAQLNKIRSELHSWFRGYRAAPIWTLTRAASLLSLSAKSMKRPSTCLVRCFCSPSDRDPIHYS